MIDDQKREKSVVNIKNTAIFTLNWYVDISDVLKLRPIKSTRKNVTFFIVIAINRGYYKYINMVTLTIHNYKLKNISIPPQIKY